MSSFIAEVKSDLMGEQIHPFVVCWPNWFYPLFRHKWLKKASTAGYAVSSNQFGWKQLTEALNTAALPHARCLLTQLIDQSIDLSEELKLINASFVQQAPRRSSAATSHKL